MHLTLSSIIFFNWSPGGSAQHGMAIYPPPPLEFFALKIQLIFVIFQRMFNAAGIICKVLLKNGCNTIWLSPIAIHTVMMHVLCKEWRSLLFDL